MAADPDAVREGKAPAEPVSKRGRDSEGEPLTEPDWEQFVRNAAGLGVTLSAAQVASLRRYLDLLCEWNRRFNLTAIERPDEILLKHFLDSLTCRLGIDLNDVRTLADVGTGAGFPGLVLKIAYPHMELLLLDSVRKKVGFLERVAADLELTGVRALAVRAEEAARPDWRTEDGAAFRERCDLVTARAVSRLNVLSEWTLPFVRTGGHALYMKGPEVEEELAEAASALRILGGGEPGVTRLTLPRTDVGRSLILVPKLRTTPNGYPRPTGATRKRPL